MLALKIIGSAAIVFGGYVCAFYRGNRKAIHVASLVSMSIGAVICMFTNGME